jgi:AraC-like DNA-binding protein
MRLLKVRQLHEIRAVLLRADSDRDTVSRIAARLGIWDFSLFARNYKAMFGESPSRTLRTPASAVPRGGSGCPALIAIQWAKHRTSECFKRTGLRPSTATRADARQRTQM